jgi:F-box-like
MRTRRHRLLEEGSGQSASGSNDNSGMVRCLSPLQLACRPRTDHTCITKTVSSAFASLPLDIFVEIALQYVWTCDGLPQDLVLVCKRWRDVTNTTHRLWSKVYFVFFSPPWLPSLHGAEGRQICKTPDQIKRAIARVGSAPLDIVVHISHIAFRYATKTCGQCPSVLEQLAQSDVKRWSSLRVISSCIPALPFGRFKGHFLRLRELSIESSSVEFWAHEILRDAPALEAFSLTINSFGLRPSVLTSYPSWSRLRRLVILEGGLHLQISINELIQKSPMLEELTLSPAKVTGVKLTPATSQFLRQLTLHTEGLSSVPHALASLPVLSCLTLICGSTTGSTPREFITLPALRQLSMIGRCHFLPCILAPELYSLCLEESGYPSSGSPEVFIKAAWNTNRAHSDTLRPLHLTFKNVAIQTTVLSWVLKQNPQLTTFRIHGWFPRATFFKHLAKDTEGTAPRLENIHLRETMLVTPWPMIRSSVTAVVRARYGPGRTLKSLFCISDLGEEEIATGREFCV